MKKILSILLAGIFLLTFLVGCQNELSEAQKRSKEVDKEFGSAVTDIMNGVTEYREEISSAGTIFDDKNESSKTQQDFTKEDMQKVKKGMTYNEVCEALNGTPGEESERIPGLFFWHSHPSGSHLMVTCIMEDGTVSDVDLDYE